MQNLYCVDGNPLTIDELHEMDGKPVWIENLENPEKSQWRLCHWDRGKYLVLQGISIQGYLLEDYGETWVAYASEPPRLDRSAWEPCKICKSCLTCTAVTESINQEPCVSCNRYSNHTSSNFCPNCGRPLTDAAWKMLEIRIATRHGK